MKKISGMRIPNMPMKSVLFIAVCFIALNKKIAAQDEPSTIFGKVTAADFDLSANKIIDSGTSAVIISNVGNIRFIGNKTNNWISYVFKKSTRIKILNKNGYDFAAVTFRSYGGNEKTQDKLDNLQATTYNLENGIVSERKLSSDDIFEERISRNLSEKKFTMPNVKEGSIIEYTYTITSNRYWDLPNWTFQSQKIPSLYSEFQITVPDLLRYVTERHGIDSFNSITNVDGYEKIEMESVNVGTSMHTHKWIMKDVAPLKKEPFVYSPADFADRLEFYLVQTYNGNSVSNEMIDWKSANDQLMKSKDFGAAFIIENTVNLQNTIEKAQGATTNLLEASKNIFRYVRDNFTCVPNNYIFLHHDLYEINKAKKGNVAELNLLLVALLRQKGLKADPVLLSTRDYGFHPTNFPILEKMNYVICLLQLYGDTIYLDASQPQLGFGKLPLTCYNGHAQVINENHGGSIFLYADAIKEARSTSVFLYNNDKGDSTTGTFQFNPGHHESFIIRNRVAETGDKAFFKSYKDVLTADFDMANTQINDVKNFENPIVVSYDLSLKIDTSENLIYFSPVIYNEYKENPFKSDDRQYPIEMQYPLDDIYVLNMEIPKNYTVEELPKSAKVAFNGTEGFFDYVVSHDATTIQLRCRVKLKHCLFEAEDNKPLRDFFAYIIKKQSEQIVFKKIK